MPRFSFNPAIFWWMLNDSAARIRVGFLHLGAPEHGVSRYGRRLAAQMATREDCAVREVEVADVAEPSRTRILVREAMRDLADRDIVQIQFNRGLFGEGTAQVRLVRALFDASRTPVVANLHDVYLDNPWLAWRKAETTLRVRFERARYFLTRTRPARRALADVVRRSAASLVCFECERDRLAKLPGADRTRVVPHFVEPRPMLPKREDARRALDVEHRRVVAVLGYIHRRKGHDLVVDALPHLPEDVVVAFVGKATDEHGEYLRSLERRAEKVAGKGRLIVTGFVDEPLLESWLAATDVAVCPFRFFSASGSLATWISAAKPIVCHELPQIAEYRRVEPTAFSTFSRYEPRALADAISTTLAREGGGIDPAIARLREEFSLERVTDRTVAVYREILAPSKPVPSPRAKQA